MKTLFFLILCASSLFAQSGLIPERFVPRRLAQFLNLTEGQTAQIVDQMTQHEYALIEMLQRIDTLYEEVVAETARPQPRPVELGMRYVEMELICRRGLDEWKRLRDKNLSVLTATQKERLKVLSDALKMLPEIGEAQYVSLLDDRPFVGLIEELPPVAESAACSVAPSYRTPPTGPSTTRATMLPRLVRQTR